MMAQLTPSVLPKIMCTPFPTARHPAAVDPEIAPISGMVADGGTRGAPPGSVADEVNVDGRCCAEWAVRPQTPVLLAN